VLSRSSEYAVRSLALLAVKGGEEWLHCGEIAQALDLPPQFLTKILRRLTREGLVDSQRGRSGGFRLARLPERIPLLAVVTPFEAPFGSRSCLLGRAQCSDEDACPLHEPWLEIHGAFFHLLEHTTLAQVAARTVDGIFPGTSGAAGIRGSQSQSTKDSHPGEVS